MPFTEDEWTELEANWSPVAYHHEHPMDERMDIIGLDTSRLDLQYNRRSFIRNELIIEG